MRKEGDDGVIGITRATPLKDALRYGRCRGGRDCEPCSNKCKVGSGFLAGRDFPKIAKKLGITETKLRMNHLEPVKIFNKTMWRPKLLRKDKPYGRCFFYNDQEKCTIHGVKPLQCKLSTCTEHGDHLNEWFILNHVVDANDPIALREWAQKLKVKKTIPGGELDELVPDKKELEKRFALQK